MQFKSSKALATRLSQPRQFGHGDLETAMVKKGARPGIQGLLKEWDAKILM